MKILKVFLAVVLLFSACKKIEVSEEKPKLVVGIVVDQMRYDYLTRFADRYGQGGFKRLITNGFSLENAHYNYIPTYTAAGHASIYTGTTPENHGIISNNWYDKYLGKSIYCVDDQRYQTIGNDGNEGKKSPFRLYTTTIGDQLKLAQNQRGKVIGIGIKDRSAILPAGHSADAAYWFDGGDNGQWVSSSFYIDRLPDWVVTFNNYSLKDDYLSEPWTTLYDITTYTNSIADDNEFERLFRGEENPTFPHDIPELLSSNGNYSMIKGIPAGNSYTKDFAKAAIEHEKLGQGEHMDFLAVSFSSTDYVGHQFGPASIEIEDTYLRLDKDIEDLLNHLDKTVGKNKYTVFLTADHAVVNVPSYLQSLQIPAHYIDALDFDLYMRNTAKKYFKSAQIIENISNFQVYLNQAELESLQLDYQEVADKLAFEAVKYDGIYKAVTAKTLQSKGFYSGLLNTLQKGYNQKFSGDILLVPYPATLTGGRKGTSHGSGYSYDTHVPVIFYGNGIQQGRSREKYNITDIAPTISNVMQIEAPNGTTGLIISEALK